MSKNCIITTVKSKIKGNATSYIERENEIFIPVSKKFSLKQTRAIAQDKVNSINKEYLSEKFGNVVSLNTSYTDGTGINIHPSKRLVDAYEVKEGNKTLEEINSNRDLEYFNGDEALLEQEQNEDNLIQKELDNLIEQTNNIEEKNDTYFSITPEVDFNLKATQILSSQKANQVFEKGKKAGWTLDKILTELQIPKEQKKIVENIYNDKINNIIKTLEKNCE